MHRYFQEKRFRPLSLACMALASLTLVPLAEAKSRTSHFDCSALRAAVAPPATPSPLPVHDLRNETERRSCMKAYPWPEGRDFNVVSSAQMAKVKEDVAAYVRQQLALPPAEFERREAIAERTRDIQFMQVYRKWKAGSDMKQTLLFGEYLYVSKLFSEGKDREVLLQVQHLKEEYDLRLSENTYDELDQYTNFNMQSLANLLLLRELQAKFELAVQQWNARRDTRTRMVELIQEYDHDKKAFAPFLPYNDVIPGGVMAVLGCQ